MSWLGCHALRAASPDTGASTPNLRPIRLLEPRIDPPLTPPPTTHRPRGRQVEAELAGACDETGKRLERYMSKARQARARVVTKLGEIKQDGEASFESSKDEIGHVWKTFKQSVNYFKSQL